MIEGIVALVALIFLFVLCLGLIINIGEGY